MAAFESKSVGDHGRWNLPDGRREFYPLMFGPSGYLVESLDQERRIRSSYRWFSVALWLPQVMVLGIDDWRWILTYTVMAALMQYFIIARITSGMTQIRESLWLIRSWQIRAFHYPRSLIVLGFVANALMIGLAAWSLRLGVPLVKALTMVAFFFLWLLRWAYIWYVKADGRI